MTLKRIVEPGELPVSFEYVRDHSRILASMAEAERHVIESMIRSATDRAERLMGRAIIRQQWEKRLDGFPAAGGAIELATPSLLSVDLVKYVDTDGVEQTLSPECYEFDAQEQTAWLVPTERFVWPQTYEKINAVKIQFTCGWVSAGVVPASIRDALVIFTAHRYENRESAEDPPGFELLLQPYRVVRYA